MKYLFIIHWLDGEKEEMKGEGETEQKAIADAFTKAGYGGGAIHSVVYYEVIRCGTCGKPTYAQGKICKTCWRSGSYECTD